MWDISEQSCVMQTYLLMKTIFSQYLIFVGLPEPGVNQNPSSSRNPDLERLMASTLGNGQLFIVIIP